MLFADGTRLRTQRRQELVYRKRVDDVGLLEPGDPMFFLCVSYHLCVFVSCFAVFFVSGVFENVAFD